MVKIGDFAFWTHQKTLLRFNFCEPLVVFSVIREICKIPLWWTCRGRRFRDGLLCSSFWSRRASYFFPFRFRWVVQCCGSSPKPKSGPKKVLNEQYGPIQNDHLKRRNNMTTLRRQMRDPKSGTRCGPCGVWSVIFLRLLVVFEIVFGTMDGLFLQWMGLPWCCECFLPYPSDWKPLCLSNENHHTVAMRRLVLDNLIRCFTEELSRVVCCTLVMCCLSWCGVV